MRDAVICEPLRTAVGGFGGVFRDLPPTELAATVIRELVRRTSLPPLEIDDVILGQCYPNGEAPAIGRVAALDAGLPIEVPGLQLDRRCGSGLQAIMLGCMEVQTGVADLVLAGGAESMSQAEFYAMGLRWGIKGGSVTLEDRLARPRVTAGGIHHPVPGGMIETAENLRRQYGISRSEQDELALRSHRRALAAQESGTFAEEIVPVAVKGRGEERLIDRDEHPRADTTLERLGTLAAADGAYRARGDRHRGERERSERRRGGVHRHPPGQGGRARLAAVRASGVVGGRGCGAGDHGHGHRPRALDAAGA